MGLTIQGGIPPSPVASACQAKETRTSEVVIDKPDKVVYRTTHTKETTLSDSLLSILDKTVSIAAAIAKIFLPMPIF